MKWLFAVRCYYGPQAEPPRMPGGLAIATRHGSVHSKEMEVAAGRSRADIGRIEVEDMTIHRVTVIE